MFERATTGQTDIAPPTFRHNHHYCYRNARWEVCGWPSLILPRPFLLDGRSRAAPEESPKASPGFVSLKVSATTAAESYDKRCTPGGGQTTLQPITPFAALPLCSSNALFF